MSNAGTPRDEAELDVFLARQSPVSAAYDAIDPVQPPEVLDGKILNLAQAAASKAAARPAAASAAPAKAPPKAPPGPAPAAPPVKTPATRAPVAADEEDDDDAPPVRRPRWLVPAALAASVLVAVGVGLNLYPPGISDDGADAGQSSRLGAVFAKRAKERREAEMAAAEAAAASQEAEVVELAPLPPPPVFEPEGPQVEDLDTAIALIRKELVLANQLAAMAGSTADTAAPAPPAAPAAAPDLAPATGPAAGNEGVIQPRDRRLAKILELYDGGNPDLAAASLEIFLRDFEDDPVSQRILDAQPKATDVAVE